MRSYETARNVFGFLGFLAWCVIILGMIAAFGGGTASQAMDRSAGVLQFLLGAAPGILMALAGVYGLAMVQMGRTSVDGAEYAQQSLAVSRQQLDVSKQLLALSNTKAATYSAAPAAGKTTTIPTAEQTISFADRPATQSASSHDPIDQQLPKPTASSSGADQIPKQAQTALSPKPAEITYQNGTFSVGGKLFGSKEDALEHQQELLALPANTSA